MEANKTIEHFSGRRWLSGQSLHLADDYLLAVNSGMFQESYRRFYYRDIQAVIVRRTGDATGMIVMMIVMLAVSLLVLFNLDNETASTIMVVFVVGLFLNLLRLVAGLGSCVCYIQTPVSIQRLSITNVRTARRLLSELAPRIEAVQGPSSQEDLRRLLAQSQTPPAPAPAQAEVMPPATPVPPNEPPAGTPAQAEPVKGDGLIDQVTLHFRQAT